MALVSIARDNGNFPAALRHARELLTLDPGNAQLQALVRNSKRRHARKPAWLRPEWVGKVDAPGCRKQTRRCVAFCSKPTGQALVPSEIARKRRTPAIQFPQRDISPTAGMLARSSGAPPASD
jgi:hypothetical protein